MERSDSHVQIDRFDIAPSEKVVSDILAVSKLNFLASPKDAPDHPSGFLVGILTEKQFYAFMNDGGTLFVAYSNGKCVAYLLVTSISEFFGYFSDNHQTETTSHTERANFKAAVASTGVLGEIENDRYIYHIATEPNLSRSGVGSLLIRRLVSDYPNTGFVTDVLVGPVPNEPSVKFFKKHGFSEIGTLDYFGYKGFGDLNTVVLRRIP